MISQLLAIGVTTLSFVVADFAGAVTGVEAEAGDLSSKINAWSSPDGLEGALGIQNDFPSLVDAVSILSNSAADLVSSDVVVDQVGSLSSTIVGLLNVLTQKSQDFRAVGADSIVTNDINSLQGPAVDVLASIISAGSDDQGKIDSLGSAFSAYSSGFDSVDDAYGIPRADFPVLPISSSGIAAAGSGPNATLATAPVNITEVNSTVPTAIGSSQPLLPLPLLNGTAPAETAVAPSNNAHVILIGLGTVVVGTLVLLL